LLQLQSDIETSVDRQTQLLPSYVNGKDLNPHTTVDFFRSLWASVTDNFETERPALNEHALTDENRFGLSQIGARFEGRLGSTWRLVLLVDELDAAAATLRDTSTFQRLRNILMEPPFSHHLRIIASGGRTMIDLCGEGSILSLEKTYLAPLTTDEIDQLIDKGFNLTKDQRQEIYELSGCHPYLTQALLGALWETREQPWSEARLLRAVQHVTRDRFGSYRRWIQSFGEHGCAVYRNLVEVGGKVNRRQLQARVKLGTRLSEAIDILEYHGVIEEQGKDVRLRGGMFRDWFNTNYEIELPALPNEAPIASRVDAVFVVHGRNDRLRVAMFTFLRALGLKPLEWTDIKEQTAGLSPYIGDILETGFARAQAVVVMLTGDDEARLRDQFRRIFDPVDEKELRPQPRPNVLFEAGMAMAKFPQATVLVQIGELRGMSDILGRHLLRMDGSLKARTELARALRKAGCTVDTDTAWQTEGKFDVES
jgi:predicted nucleotide-binding protein